MSLGFQMKTGIAREKNRPALQGLVDHTRAFRGLTQGEALKGFDWKERPDQICLRKGHCNCNVESIGGRDMVD